MWATAWWAAQPWSGYGDPTTEREEEAETNKETTPENQSFAEHRQQQLAIRLERSAQVSEAVRTTRGVGTPIAFANPETLEATG
jgi:hypothetical protein